jgi:ABC-type amino acid transport substrate-binding protein
MMDSMNYIFKIFRTLIFFVCLSCQIMPEEPLRIGVTKDYPPMAFTNKQGNLAGLEIDFARLISSHLDREIIFVPLPFSELLPNIQRKEIDLAMAGISNTLDRSFNVNFLPAYAEVSTMLLIRREQANEFQKFTQQFKSRLIAGYKKNSTGGLIINHEFNKNKQMAYDDTDQAVTALLNKEIDFLLQEEPVVSQYLQTHDNLVAIPWGSNKEALAWAVNHENHALYSSLNNIYLKMKVNGSLNKTIHKWMPSYNQGK